MITCHNSQPRIYANEELKSLFVTELEIDKSMYREIAETILKWTLDHYCRLIISATGVTTDDEKESIQLRMRSIFLQFLV